jgi:hypothetical protein
MKRRTVSLTDSAVTAVERLARRSGSNVSCVVEAAAAVIAEEGAGARAVEKRIVPDRRARRRAPRRLRMRGSGQCDGDLPGAEGFA